MLSHNALTRTRSAVRQLPLLAAALSVCLVLACGQAAAPAAPAAPASGATAAPAAPTPAANPSGASPVASSSAATTTGSAASGSSIKIGLLLSRTGGVAPLANDNFDGFNLYLDGIGSSMAGRNVEVVVADDAMRPDVSVTKAHQLIESDHVDIILGPAFSPVCNALAPYIKQAQVPMLASGACPNQTLFTDPQLKTPYIMRSTYVGSQIADVAADWLYNNGHRKAIVTMADIIGGLEFADSFSSAFVKRGGEIVQEFYPAAGTADYAPFLSQLNPDADVLLNSLPLVDALRFSQQYPDYVGDRQLQMASIAGGPTTGTNVAQLQDKAVGFVGVEAYCTCIDSQANHDFIKLFAAKYPGRLVTTDVVNGYISAQIVEAALKKINGNVQDKQAFLDALHSTNVETVKGPLSFDPNGDVIQNVYVYKIVKAGSGVDYQLLQTYPSVAATWDRTPQELATFPFGKLKGKWVGMTKDQLVQYGIQ